MKSYECFMDMDKLQIALQEYFEKRKLIGSDFKIIDVMGGVGFNIIFKDSS